MIITAKLASSTCDQLRPLSPAARSLQQEWRNVTAPQIIPPPCSDPPFTAADTIPGKTWTRTSANYNLLKHAHCTVSIRQIIANISRLFLWDLWRRLVPGAFVALQRGLGQGDPPATGKPRPSLQSILYSSMIWYFKWKFVKMWYKQSLDRSSSRVTLWQLASHRLWSTYTVNSTTSDQPTSGNIIQMPFSTIARLV